MSPERVEAPREGSAQPATGPPGAYADRPPPKQEPRVRSFSWLRLRSLWDSRNDQVAKLLRDPVFAARRAWMAQLGRTPGDDLLITRHAGERADFLLLGDPGEGDHSQFALLPMLKRRYADADFMLIASDVIYPAGGATEYADKFYLPYGDFEGPIYAVPGNHDWYDLLEGFMFHFCDAGALPAPQRPQLHWLWRTRFAPADDEARRLRDERRATGPGPQPAPYFAIEAGPLLLVCIDTGITNGIDRDQAAWLRRVSAIDKPKVLITGKPLVVDNRREPCEIEDGGTVDAVVRDPANRYVAAIGGDIHNYQRYPVELPDGRTMQYFVSGGGGAYMAATHGIPEISLERVDERAFRCFPSRSASLAFYSRRVPGVVRSLLAQCLVATALLVAVWLVDWPGSLDGWLRAASLVAALPVLAGWIYCLGIGGLRFLIAWQRNGIPEDEAKAIMKQHLPDANVVVEPKEPDPTPSWQSRWVARSLLGHHGGRRGFAHLFLSELYDSDKPHFYKHFLRLQADDETLVVTCHAVSGSEQAEDEPAVEETVTIPLTAPAGSATPAPATTWAVFSAWRGNPQTFAHAVEVAADAIAAAEGSSPPWEIVLSVSGAERHGGGLVDDERFTDPSAFAEGISPQALRRWTEVVATVTGGVFTARIHMQRANPVTRGVTLTVDRTDLTRIADAREIRNRVAATLSRGGFRRSTEPRIGEDDGGEATRHEALAARIHARGRLVAVVAVLYGLVAAAILTVVGIGVGAALPEGGASERVVVIAVLAGLLVAAGVFAFRSRLFPAVEIASVTPGRRIAQLATRGLGAGTLVTVAVQLLGRLLK